jgi:hypothetical protein
MCLLMVGVLQRVAWPSAHLTWISKYLDKKPGCNYEGFLHSAFLFSCVQVTTFKWTAVASFQSFIIPTPVFRS